MKKALIITLILFIAPGCAPKYKIDHSIPTAPIEFPRDHGAHYWAQTEWWYYTGHIEDNDGKRYGFEVSFFKRVLSEDRGPWYFLFIPMYWIGDIGILSHFAVSDFTGKKLYLKGKANVFHTWHAYEDKFDVRLGEWRVREVKGSHVLEADMEDFSIKLNLTPVKPPVLNGPGGIISMGGNTANYYYSYTNLKVNGTFESFGKKRAVKGKAWMDHQYGSMNLIKARKGWDWFSIQLDTDEELMCYILRSKGKALKESKGIYTDKNGNSTHLELADMEIKALDTWHSKDSGTTYPSKWDIHVRSLGLNLKVIPIYHEQELEIFPVTYWEGGVTAKGKHGNRSINGQGYVELVGYAKDASFGNYDR